MSWTPKRTLEQVNEILCAPGMLHQTETCLVNGRIQRVYKNLWPSLREFWLSTSEEFSDRTYITFENQRLSFRQVADQALIAASVFRNVYGVKKGERVGICARNYPQYIVAFWACHLIGAVAVLANAWLPSSALRYCLTHTGCKLVVLDPERADLLEPLALKLAEESGTTGFLVLEAQEGKGYWKNMKSWDDVMATHQRTVARASKLEDPEMSPEDNATIIFTSGTTGLPKGVLSTQRMFLTNVLNLLVGSRRATLRRGDEILSQQNSPQRGVLLSVPLFHVTGSTALTMLATAHGMKVVMMRKWIPEEAARLIQTENVGIAGGVPSMVADLTESSAAGFALDSIIFGGSPAPNQLPERASRAFPTATLSQSYGLTETNSVAVSIAGEDYALRPGSTGLPAPVNDIMIVKDGTTMPSGHVGEVWIRGPNVMKEYWRDPAATARTITTDGWFRTGDIGVTDKDGFLYIKDRIKDLIIRGGENIDSVSVENAIYEDPRVAEVAAVGVPDDRLGELVAAVVSVKTAFARQVTERDLIARARRSLAKFAVPVMILIQETPFEHTPSGKIIKGELRVLARNEWQKRRSVAPVQAKL